MRREHTSDGDDSSAVRRWRPTVGKKLAAAFLLLMVMTTASLMVAESLYNTVADTPALINESARLRYLSQQIGHKAARLAQDGAEREALVRVAGDYDAKLAEIEAKCAESFPAGGRLADALASLRRDWNGQRALVDRLVQARTAEEAGRLHEEVYRGSDALLAGGDTLVGELVAVVGRNHRRIDALIYLALAADVLFLAAVFYLIRRTVTQPVVEASRALHRFAAGDRQTRLPIDSADEIGDLCRAFNRTAEQTGRLILELATKSAILDETSDFVGTADRTGRLLYVNRAGLLMLARESDATDGLRLDDCFPSWARAMVRDIGLATATRAGTWSGEIALLTSDGREIPVSQVIVAHKAPNGEVAYFSTIMRDMSERIGLEVRLTQSRDFYLKLFHDFPNPIWRAGTDAQCDYFNKAWLDFTGRSLVEEIGDGWAQGVHAEDLERCVKTYRDAFAARRPFEMEYRLRRHDGEYRWILDSGAPFFDMDGVFSGFIGSCHDITARKGAEDNLRLWRRAIEASVNPIVITDALAGDDPIVYANPAFERITGYKEEEALGRNPRFLHADDQEQAGLATIRTALRERREGRAVVRNYRKGGTPYWNELIVAPVRDEHGAVTHHIGVQNDITERKRYEEQLEFQATHDALTGLPNRNLLSDRLEQAVVHAVRSGHAAAVLFLDLDQFKFVNDSLGHAAGDRLLAAVAERLRGAVRQGDTVARQGGDEFVVVLADVVREADVADVVQKLLHCLHAPFPIDEHELFVTASIGVSVHPQDGSDVQTLLRNADMAMYRAKDEGRNNFQFFTADMNARFVERLTIEGSLRRALEREELLLYYQPQVDLASGQMIGMEALLRWRHPELGLVPPAKFIPLAEETGLIVAIGAWVLKKACAQNKAWQDAGLPRLMVSVNLSARQFGREDLVDIVRRTLAETGLEARYLELELTESMIMRDPGHVIDVLRRFSDMGVQLSIDDFGTGYSSLNYLKRFPIDKVKIDQSFVRDITTDPDDAAIAKTIVSIAHDMRLKVIAEGTETEGQVNALRSYGCDAIQGYLFSRPVPAEDMEALLREGRRLPMPAVYAAPERTLLLVDDEANVINALTRLLRPDGYHILRAESGAAALDLLAMHRVGVIVSDQRMPGMSGVEFLRRAKEIYPDSVRLVLSGYTELKSVTDAINEGAVYKFLTKPWEDDLLRDNIREAFQRFELRAENERLARDLAAANQRLSADRDELEIEVEHSVGVLKVSQEIFELLPIGALGLDGDGCVVAANGKAEEILAGDPAHPLIGAAAVDRLPPAMVACVERVLRGRAADSGVWRSPAGGEFAFQCHVMGATSRSQGAVLTLLPVAANVS